MARLMALSAELGDCFGYNCANWDGVESDMQSVGARIEQCVKKTGCLVVGAEKESAEASSLKNQTILAMIRGARAEAQTIGREVPEAAPMTWEECYAATTEEGGMQITAPLHDYTTQLGDKI